MKDVRMKITMGTCNNIVNTLQERNYDTGEYYATGDFILVADTVNGSKEIYRWK